jgi:gamma-glutamylcyclotransferase (GGCT)/AIG2-like uncharacterized protein YtfP
MSRLLGDLLPPFAGNGSVCAECSFLFPLPLPARTPQVLRQPDVRLDDGRSPSTRCSSTEKAGRELASTAANSETLSRESENESLFGTSLAGSPAETTELNPDEHDQPVRLFVYGTLMPGCPNYHRIERYVLAHRPGRIKGVLVDLGAFPALISGDGVVEGVVLVIAPEALHLTDCIEGCYPHRKFCLYKRKQAQVTLNDNSLTTAWVYIYGEPHLVENCPRLLKESRDGISIYSWPAQ